MFANFHKTPSMFAPSIQFVSTEKKDEPPPMPDFIPIAKTKAEAKKQQKYQWLPGERLSISMARDALKQKKKDKKQKKDNQLSTHDIDNISASVSRITGLISPQIC